MPEPDIAKLRVLAHPLRLRILSLLTSNALSAAEVARELEETQANVSYHLRKLHDAGLLYVAEEISIRGGKAKRYRHAPESGLTVKRGSVGDEQLLTKALGAELVRRVRQIAPEGKNTLTDAELWVDREIWLETFHAVHRLSARLHAAAVPPRTEGAVHVSVVMSLFEMDDQR